MLSLMAPTVSLAMASRAENLLMAEIAIRLLNPASRRVLFCDVPCNASRRSGAIRSLIASMAWDVVQASPTIKYSSMPAWLRRGGGRPLEKATLWLALSCSLVRVVAYGIRHREAPVDLACGRPRLAFLLLCHLLRPERILFLDTGPKINAFKHLSKAFAQFRVLLRLVGLSGRIPSTLEADLDLLSDRPIPLLCWSIERYRQPLALAGRVQPLSVDQLIAESGGAPLYGSAEGSPYVFLIGKPTESPYDDLPAMIALWRATCPQATPVYFLHPREQPEAAETIMAAHGIAIADRALCIESHVMTSYRDVALQLVISIRASRSLETLRLLYGEQFDVRLIR